MRHVAPDTVDPDVLARLRTRHDAPGLRRLAVQVPWLLASGWWLVTAQGTASFLAALLLHGAAQCTLFAPFHETNHGTAFATPWLNRGVGAVTGFVQLMPPALLRSFHAAHHRRTHVDGDPEVPTPAMARWPRGLFGAMQLTGLPLMVGRTGWTVFAAVGLWPEAAWQQVLPFVSDRARPRVVRQARLHLLAHGLLIAMCLVVPGLARLYLAAWVGHALLAVYLAAEHAGLPMAGSMFERTRSFAGHPVVDFLFWNMPHHAEHHAWPAVPFHALPALHQAARPHLVHTDRRLSALWWAQLRGEVGVSPDRPVGEARR